MPPSVPPRYASALRVPNPFEVISALNSAQQPPNSGLTCTVGRPSGGDDRAGAVLGCWPPSALTCANSQPALILSVVVLGRRARMGVSYRTRAVPDPRSGG